MPIRHIAKPNYSQIARETGLSPSYISRLMRGERIPSAKSLLRLSRSMHESVDEILRRIINEAECKTK